MLEGVRAAEPVCYLSRRIIQTAFAHVPFETCTNTLCLSFRLCLWGPCCVHVCVCVCALACTSLRVGDGV